MILGYQTAAYPSAPGGWVPALYVGTDGKLRGEIYHGGSQITSPFAVNDGLRVAADVCGDNRKATSHSLEECVREALLPRREEKQVSMFEERPGIELKPAHRFAATGEASNDPFTNRFAPLTGGDVTERGLPAVSVSGAGATISGAAGATASVDPMTGGGSTCADPTSGGGRSP